MWGLGNPGFFSARLTHTCQSLTAVKRSTVCKTKQAFLLTYTVDDPYDDVWDNILIRFSSMYVANDSYTHAWMYRVAAHSCFFLYYLRDEHMGWPLSSLRTVHDTVSLEKLHDCTAADVWKMPLVSCWLCKIWEKKRRKTWRISETQEESSARHTGTKGCSHL